MLTIKNLFLFILPGESNYIVVLLYILENNLYIALEQ